MKILIISSDFYPQQGGISRIAVQLTNHLAFKHAVTVITSVENISDRQHTYEIYNIIRPGTSPLLATFSLFRFKKSDLVIATDSNYSGILAAWMCFIFGIKGVNLCHGLDCFGWDHNKIMYRLYQLLFKNFTVTIVNSLKTARIAKQKGIGRNIRILKPGITMHHQVPQTSVVHSTRPFILSVSRLVQRKNLDTCIRAFYHLNNENIDYLIIGDGPQKQYLSDLIDELEMKKHIHILSNIDDGLLVEYYRNCIFFLLVPLEFERDYEGFGLVYLEANAYGKSVIASDTGGIPDAVVHGLNGVVVSEITIENLSYTIKELLENDDLRNRLESNAFKWAHLHSSQSMLSFYDELLKEII